MNVPVWVCVATAFGLAIPVGIDVWRARTPHPVDRGTVADAWRGMG